MKKLSIAMSWAVVLSACTSSTNKGEVQDGSDAQAMAQGDAAAQDASHLDASSGGTQLDGASTLPPASNNDAALADGAVSMSDGGTPLTVSSFVFVGGYGNPYAFRSYTLDRNGGTLNALGSPVTTLGENPTYVAVNAAHTFLYLANESDSNPGVTVASLTPSGVVSRVEQESAAGPLVFTSLDPQGKYVLTASYNDGFVSVFPIQTDGSLGAAVDTKNFMKPSNADSAQTHSIRTHPSGKWAYVPNKGLNAVAQYSFDENTGKLSALSPAMVTCAGGPRHIAFKSDGSLAFVMTELSSELVVYRVGSNGALSEIQRASALPGTQTGNAGAHVLVHPNDKFVYTSNRTDNSIVVFSLSSDSKVSQIQSIKTMGTIPRNFDIDSQGKFLIAANQGDSGKANGSLVVFAIGEDGMLTQRSLVNGVESPAAVSIVTNP